MRHCVYTVTGWGSKTQSTQSAKLFLQSLELGLPQPLKRGEYASVPPPPPLVPGGGAHSLAGEGWGKGGPNSDAQAHTL